MKEEVQQQNINQVGNNAQNSKNNAEKKAQKDKPSVALCIYVVGSQKSGKSFFIQKFIKQKNPNKKIPYQISKSHIYQAKLYENDVTLRIWDMSGNPEVSPLRQRLYKNKGAKVLIILYEVSNQPSFNQVQKYIKQWQRSVDGIHQSNIIIVANKIDLQKYHLRVIGAQKGLKVASSYGLIYLQSSVLFYSNNQIFQAAYILKQSQLGNSPYVQKYLKNSKNSTKSFWRNMERYQNFKQLHIIDYAKQWQQHAMKLVRNFIDNQNVIEGIIIVMIRQIGSQLIKLVPLYQQIKTAQDKLRNINQIKAILQSSLPKEYKNITKIESQDNTEKKPVEEIKLNSNNSLEQVKRVQKIVAIETDLTLQKQKMIGQHSKILKDLYKKVKQLQQINFVNIYTEYLTTLDVIIYKLNKFMETVMGNQRINQQEYLIGNNKKDDLLGKKLQQLMLQIEQQYQKIQLCELFVIQKQKLVSQMIKYTKQKLNLYQEPDLNVQNTNFGDFFIRLMDFYIENNLADSQKKQSQNAKKTQNIIIEIGIDVYCKFQLKFQNDNEQQKQIIIQYIKDNKMTKYDENGSKCADINCWNDNIIQYWLHEAVKQKKNESMTNEHFMRN